MRLFKKKRIDVIEKFFHINNRLILEIGTHKGDFATVLLEKFKPKKLVLVDPWIAEKEKIYQSSWYGNFDGGGQKIQDSYYQNVKKKFEQQINKKQVEILRMKSSEAFKILKNKFDLIYIDGNHLYNYVLEDLENSLNIINNNGLIVLDDFMSKGWWDDGVTKAVNHLKELKKFKILHQHDFLNQHLQCILKKI